MTSEDEPTFSLDEALAAQQALRVGAGLKPERFPIQAFVGMISDEIEAWRAAGRSDVAIAEAIEDATGHRVSPEAIARFYAPPEGRRG